MKTAAKIVIYSALLLGCDGQETDSSCGPKNSGYARSNQDLELLKKPPGRPGYFPNVIMVLSGDKTQKMTWCSGIVVGHNSALTSASCLKGGVELIYVVPKLDNSLSSSDPEVQNKLISMSIKPSKVVSHGTIPTTATTIEPSKQPDDLAVLLFADKTFEVENYNTTLIGSLYEGYPRPKIRQRAMTLGYGGQLSYKIAEKYKRGIYLRDETALKDLLFYHDIEPYPPGAGFGIEMFHKTFEADRGAPLLTPLDVKRGEDIDDYNRSNIVGLLVHMELVKATTQAQPDKTIAIVSSSNMNLPDRQKQIYVDLYSDRSVGLLKKAANDGANFLQPAELYEPKRSRGNDVVRPKQPSDCKPNRPN